MTTITDNRNDGGVHELLFNLARYPLARRLTWAFIDNNYIGVGQGFQTDKGKCYKASEAQRYTGMTVFSGNFYNWSWTFFVATDEPELIEKLTTAIRENMQRPDYLAQEKPTSKIGEHYILMDDGREFWFDNGEYKQR